MFRPAKQTGLVPNEQPKGNPNNEAKEEVKSEAKQQEINIYGGEGPTITSPQVIQTTRSLLTVKPEREDIISLGGVASPNNAGVAIVTGVAGQKVKVYDAGYEALAAGLHYFYFGTSTTATAKRLMASSTKGARFKTFVQPRVSADGEGLYLFSAVSETNMPYDAGYVQE